MSEPCFVNEREDHIVACLCWWEGIWRFRFQRLTINLIITGMCSVLRAWSKTRISYWARTVPVRPLR